MIDIFLAVVIGKRVQVRQEIIEDLGIGKICSPGVTRKYLRILVGPGFSVTLSKGNNLLGHPNTASKY